MPFRQGKSPSDVSRIINKALTVDLPANVEKAMFTMYTTLAGTADYYVPVDTTALVKSRSYRVRREGDTWRMTYGYYTAYARALHEGENWQPQPPGTKRKPDGGYNPNAQPQWMNLAWNEVGQDALKAFGRMIEP